MTRSPIIAATASTPQPLLTRRVAQLLLAQATFSFGWSLYLLAPKFYATTLAATPEDIGRISSMGGLSSIISLPFALRVIDGGSRRRLFWLGCTALGVLSLGYLGVTRVGPELYVLQGLLGVGFVFTFNATATLVADLAPASRLGEALGLVGAANMVMNAVATIVGERLSLRFGWTPVFWIAAATSLLAAAIALGIKESPRPKRSETTADSKLPLRSLVLPLMSILLIGATFIVMFVFYQPYALSLGASELQNYFVGFTATAVMVRVALGSMGDRFGRVRISIAAAVLYSLAGLSMMRLNLSWLWLHGAFLGLAHGVFYPTLNAVVIGRAPPQARGRAMTLYSGAFSIGTSASGWLCGMQAQRFGFEPVFATGAALALMAATLLLIDLRTIGSSS